MAQARTPDHELEILVSEARERFRLARLATSFPDEAGPMPTGVVTPRELEEWFSSRGVAVRATLRGRTLQVERFYRAHLNVRLVPAEPA